MPTIDFDNLFSQADIFRNSGRVEEAVQAYADIAQLAQEENELVYRARAMQMAGASLNSTVTPKLASRSRDAQNFISQAIDLYRQLNDNRGEGAAWRDMAISQGKFRQDNSALTSFQKSIELLEQAEDKSELGITYDKLGKLLARRGDLAGAIQHLNKAESLFRQDPSNGFYQATTLYDKAIILTLKGDLDAAVSLTAESLSWFEADHGEEKFEERCFEISCLAAVLWSLLGEPKKAREYENRQQKLIDKLDPEVANVIERELETLLAAANIPNQK